ncbi:MAG TPA: ScbR family autoregulator-binding transcription factor [Actinomycetota bacterium]|jgi:TetR/AcrR family transcriptional repressor of nem operon|nr:ScbR family autoregulator-binding transcription factor [Actinomycetota bacterium]
MTLAPTATDRGTETRRRILEVAAEAFAERGYAGTSLNDVLKASGVTKGGFYFHFPSKEALALATLRQKQEKWTGVVMAAVLRHPRAVDQLHAMVEALCDLHEQDRSCRAISRLSAELGDAHPELRPQLGTQLTAWMDMVAAVVRRGQDEGDIRPEVDPAVAAEVAVGAFIGLETVSEVLTGRADLRRRARDFRDLWFAAIRQPTT